MGPGDGCHSANEEAYEATTRETRIGRHGIGGGRPTEDPLP